MNRKSELRKIVVDIIFGRESVFFESFQFGHLTAGVAEVLHQKTGADTARIFSIGHDEQRLSEEDWLLVQEIFWDLVFERVINTGSNKDNPAFPWFRLHSDAKKNLRIE